MDMTEQYIALFNCYIARMQEIKFRKIYMIIDMLLTVSSSSIECGGSMKPSCAYPKPAK